MLSFKFNFLSIKSLAGEIPVVLCGVIQNVNKTVFIFTLILPDPSNFLKVFLKVLTSLSAHPFVVG